MRKRFIEFVLLSCCLMSLVSCASLNSLIGRTKGALIGQEFVISQYDNFANKTLEVSGSKVNIGLLENDSNLVDSTNSSVTFPSTLLEITVNGHQMFNMGNTLIFAEKGLDVVKDFEVPSEINVNKGGSLVSIDRMLNNYKNLIGAEKIIVVYSQTGIPIGVYQGKDVYVEVPDDLPKMTLLNIDGKSLYVHRANYVILDSEMVK